MMTSVRAQTYDEKDNSDGLMSEKGKFRISPVKTRDSIITRKSLKPFSSSIIQDKKAVLSKQDLIKINSKL